MDLPKNCACGHPICAHNQRIGLPVVVWCDCCEDSAPENSQCAHPIFTDMAARQSG